ncbi:MAG: N-acetylmuramoyl-L-alanine amidase, partial [Thermoplasmata archaeon]|nr:N-acetylmuramoyl-L-alanine amidase [Thermoplasmata archaeon]
MAASNPSSGNNRVFADDLESGVGGWAGIGTAEWEYGTPLGLGGEHGNADPNSAVSGNNVLGVDLSGDGDYEPDIVSTAWLDSPVVDCQGYSDVHLQFQRYLNVESPLYDHAYSIAYDGSDWYIVFENTAEITDSAWTPIDHNISSYADGNPDLQVSFGIGPTDDAWQYGGWNIDDIVINGIGPQYRDYMSTYMVAYVNLSGHTGCQLDFHHWLAIEDYWDIASVKAASVLPPTVGAGWTVLEEYGNTSGAFLRDDGHDPEDWDPDACKWEQEVLSLAAFDDGPLYLMFLLESDESTVREGWYLDEIKITGTGKSYDDHMEAHAEFSVDLTGYDNAYISFDYWADVEDYWDTFGVQAKNFTDPGWTDIVMFNDNASADPWQYDGVDPDLMARWWWNTGHLSLDQFCDNDQVMIRFWFSSDAATRQEGVYVDNIEVGSVFFYDEVETGVNGWTTTSPTEPNWHIVSTDYYSYDHSWWCGADGTSMYGGSMDEYLTRTFDLRTAEAAALRFYITGDALANDYLFVGISIDGGGNWDYYGGITGELVGWWYYEIDLSPYVHHQAQLAFNFYSNKTGNTSGYWIDDITVYGLVDVTPPGQVVGVSVEALSTGTEMSMIWDANPEIDLDHYEVYRSLTSGGPYDHIASSFTNAYLDTGLTSGITYYYVVSATDFGANEGATSLEASNTTVDSLPPGPVQGVEAMDQQTGGEVEVTWISNMEKDLAGYKVYYNTTDFTNASHAEFYILSPIDDTGATACLVDGLSNDIPYYFAVTAIDKGANENTSIDKTVIATPTDNTAPYVEITYPTEGTPVTGVITIMVSADDTSGIFGVNITINKTAYPANYDPFLRRWTYDWDTSTSPDGPITIDAQAEDYYHNLGADSVNVTKTTMRVCIDPGHGGGDLGMVGWSGSGNPEEKDMALDIALRVRSLLEAEGVQVFMTRTDDTAPNLQDRVDTANTNNADILVSIHTACNDTYDRARAAEYADTYWDVYNPAYNDYTSSGGDCANFVSQCLMAGGRILEGGDDGMEHGVDNWGCMPFCDYLHLNLINATWGQDAAWTTITGGSGSPPGDLQAGDVIIYGDTSGDWWRHAVFVVGGMGDTAMINGHTTDRYHEAWDYAYPGSFDRVNFYHLPDTTGRSPAEDNGTRTFYWGTSASYSTNGRKLAIAVQNETVEAIGSANLTTRRDAVWYGHHLFVL